VCGAYFGPQSDHGGASLLQVGNPERKVANYNAQLLIENPSTGASGPYDFAHAALCGANSRLLTLTYPYESGFTGPNEGLSGYKDYMRWVKAQVMAGNQVTVAVLYNGGTDPQYDHEVSVLKIGTNHSPQDAEYYDDDVLYFEDHGAYTLKQVDGKWDWAWNPSVPPGAGHDEVGCTPYVFAYRFDALPHTRASANADGAPGYSIVIPQHHPIETGSGNTARNGASVARVQASHNYGFAVQGPLDQDQETLPVVLQILRTRSLKEGEWRDNPWDEQSDPPVGNNYETPYIGGPLGACNEDDCVSNVQPPAMLMDLQATVSDLQEGKDYNLYQYDFPTLTGADVAAAAALRVPTGAFNRNRAMATSVVHFTATGATFTWPLSGVSSDRIIVLRAVPADAP
jgi:hypothetical protein